MQSVELHKASEFPTDLEADWLRLLEEDSTLDSPYFRPEFTQTVAALRSDVEVAVVREDGRAVAFFPFQRGVGDVGRPVGGRLSDFHGVIGHQNVRLASDDLIRACGLTEYAYTHLPASQTVFECGTSTPEDSPYLDLSDGFEPYLAERKKQSSEIKKLGRKFRQLEKEFGPLEFVLESHDERIFDQLIRWKIDQYVRSDLTNLFEFDWTLELLHTLQARTTPELRGMLSVLSAGNRVIAIHYGMRSLDVLHSWFPAFDRELRKYSPGLLLLHSLAEGAAADGVRRIDLGRGDQSFKLKFASAALPLREGCLAVTPMRRIRNAAWNWARKTAKRPALRPLLQVPAGMVRRRNDRKEFE